MNSSRRWFGFFVALTTIFYASLTYAAYQFHDGTVITGYLDTSYNHLLQSNKFISGSYNRVYDLQQSGFRLQQAALAIEKTSGKGSVVI